jgi:hypothetical protein
MNAYYSSAKGGSMPHTAACGYGMKLKKNVI